MKSITSKFNSELPITFIFAVIDGVSLCLCIYKYQETFSMYFIHLHYRFIKLMYGDDVCVRLCVGELYYAFLKVPILTSFNFCSIKKKNLN